MSRKRADVAIIGSGAAGAVVAARLAERGARVVILEEGPRLYGHEVNGDVLASLRRGYKNGGALFAIGRPTMPVQVGRCVGGSTTINGGTCFRTPTDVLEAWSRQLDSAFTPSHLAPYFDEVERDLNIIEVPPELAFVGERRFLEAARARGSVSGYVKRGVVACQGTGLCAFVCPTGAKQSMEVTYIPRAEQAGAELLANTCVDSIRVQGRHAAGVRATSLANGSGPFEVDADAVVLCAGALHTPLLLQASLGSRAPTAVGRHLTLHPATHVCGVLPEEVEPRHGPIQSVYVEGPNRDFVIFGMGYPPEVLSTMLVGGSDSLGRLALYPRTITVAVMGSDHHAAGRVRRMPGGGPLLVYDVDQECARSVLDGIAHACELMFDLGAVEVHHGIRRLPPFDRPDQVEPLRRATISKQRLILGSVHPMGTCRMGLDPKTSAVDTEHRVHGIDGLYVPDASFLPSSLGVNPQETINAFALRCADRIAEHLGG